MITIIANLKTKESIPAKIEYIGTETSLSEVAKIIIKKGKKRK